MQTRIGTCTFHYAVNPGSFLQAYALYQTISSLKSEFDVHIINYQTTWYRQSFLSFRPKLSISDNINRLFNRYAYLRYQRFWKCIGGRGKRLDEKSIGKLSGYDVIVAGSDQIWNLDLTNKNFDFFVPFCKKAKKIAYAASIGTKDFPEDAKEKVAYYLKDFSYLSVREPQAQLAIERLIGIKPELVVDPSLLLQRCDWEKMARKPRMKKDYVFLYLRHKDSEMIPFARSFAKKNELQIVECHGKIRKIFKDDQITRKPEPREWLGWLLNAKYVFTDSFHGCAFCINCHKPFFVKISSANQQMGSRIFNILDRYGLNDRMIESEEKMFALPEIDFTQNDILLQRDREHSMNYLKTALGIKEL